MIEPTAPSPDAVIVAQTLHRLVERFEAAAATIAKAGAEPTFPVLALRSRDAARALGVSERTWATWTKQGIVPRIRIGRVVIHPVTQLEQWLAETHRGHSGMA